MHNLCFSSSSKIPDMMNFFLVLDPGLEAEEKQVPAPVRIQTYNWLIISCVFFRYATTGAQIKGTLFCLVLGTYH